MGQEWLREKNKGKVPNGSGRIKRIVLVGIEGGIVNTVKKGGGNLSPKRD